jgi:hypothetical protein
MLEKHLCNMFFYTTLQNKEEKKIYCKHDIEICWILKTFMKKERAFVQKGYI